jgi:hypothetical protein
MSAPTTLEPAQAVLTGLHDLGLAWRRAREDVQDAYAAWCDASNGERRDAFVVLVAAMDREHAAERGYLAARETA